MKKILRSVIEIDKTLTQDELRRNFMFLSQSDLDVVDEQDEEIWDYIKEYALNYSALPTLDSIKDYFNRENAYQAVERLEEISAINKTYTSADFENLVESRVKSQKDQEMQVLLRTANDILYDGLTLKEGREKVNYEGHQGAMRYILERGEHLMKSDRGGETKSDIVQDADKMRQEFNEVLSTERQSWGCITGLRDIDAVTRGIKPGQLWIHSGYAGDLKTTFSLNWAYRAAFLLQWNVYYLSLEMSVEQIRRIIYVMHSNHPKFNDLDYPSLNYSEIKSGEDKEGNPISPEQEEFFRHVIDDIEENRGKSYGSLTVKSPDEEVTVPKLRQDLEVTHRQNPVHLVVIDHFALMSSHVNTGSYYTNLNAIVRDTKRMALSFNDGEKIPVIGLLQINREGRKEAEKNDGRYKMQALADANEAERSADVITYTFTDDEMRENNRVLFGMLKHRDGPSFKPFNANIHWPTRYISNNIPNNEALIGIQQGGDTDPDELADQLSEED